MKTARFIFGVAAGLLLTGCSPSGSASAEKPPAAEEEPGPKVTRDAAGNTVIQISDEAQGNIGILVKKPEAARLNREIKGFGRVLDPSPLVAVMSELAAARATFAASREEVARARTLTAQGNATPRALQAAEAAAARDELAVQSALDRIALAWGKNIAAQTNNSPLLAALTSQDSVLVSVSVPLGESLSPPPPTCRLSTLSGQTMSAEFIGAATAVDPALQSQALIYQIKTNDAHLSAGAAVTAYVLAPGEAQAGVVIPREAVVRKQGAGWIYLHGNGGEAFTRVEIPLDHPTEAGWFVTKGVTVDDHIVTTGAQQLLSLELKGQGGD